MTRRGFTKIELVVVVSVTLVLCLTIKPNVHYPHPRAKVSRARHDLRELATALQAYHLANGYYPQGSPLRPLIPSERTETYASASDVTVLSSTLLADFLPRTTSSQELVFLNDPFAPERQIPYAYHSAGMGWILYSPGPDRRYDITPITDYNGVTTRPAARLILKSYDPTNGIESAGDIWRTSD